MRKFIVSSILIVLVAAGWPKRSQADGDSLRCLSIDARIEVSLFVAGCMSPVGFCTQGVIRSRSGWLHGTTEFMAGGLGGDVMGEDSIVTPPSEPASTWSYAGQLDLDTPVGELHLEDVGVFDTDRGTFAETDRVVGGTGLFEGATGDLFMYGHAYEDRTGFSGDVRGEVCVPRRRHERRRHAH